VTPGTLKTAPRAEQVGKVDELVLEPASCSSVAGIGGSKVHQAG